MKITIEFDDKNEALVAMGANKLVSVVAQMLEELRKRRKYSDCEVSEDLEQYLWELVNEEELTSLIYGP